MFDGIIARELGGVDDGVSGDVGSEPRPQSFDALGPHDRRVGSERARVPPGGTGGQFPLCLHPHFDEIGRGRDADRKSARGEARDDFEAQAVARGARGVGDRPLQGVVQADAQP